MATQAGAQALRFGLPTDDISAASRHAPFCPARSFAPDPIAGPLTSDAVADAAGVVTFCNHAMQVHGTGPGSNLTCTADGLARVMATFRPDGMGAGSLISPDTLAAATTPVRGADGATIQSGMGLGYMLAIDPTPAPNAWRFGPWPDAFGHMGAGGRMATFSPVHNMAIVVAKNAVSPDPYTYATWTTIATAISVALGVPVGADQS